MDYNIDYIRQQFKSYENNMDSEPGHSSMQCFIDSGFDDIPDCFRQLKGKMFIEHLHRKLIEVGGEGFSDDAKNELLQSINKKKD